MSSNSERSQSRHSRERSRSKPKQQRNKMFVTNLDGSANEEELKTELEALFQKYGTIKDLSVKKSKNRQYCFAFVEYGQDENAEEAIKNLDGHQVRGKFMKVELQNDSKRRKDSDKGCYNCGKKGHFARECRSGIHNDRRRSPHRSSEDRDRRRRRRSESDSSDHKRKKSSKKDKSEKKKKKHHKRRNRSSSASHS